MKFFNLKKIKALIGYNLKAQFCLLGVRWGKAAKGRYYKGT